MLREPFLQETSWQEEAGGTELCVCLCACTLGLPEASSQLLFCQDLFLFLVLLAGRSEDLGGGGSGGFPWGQLNGLCLHAGRESNMS